MSTSTTAIRHILTAATLGVALIGGAATAAPVAPKAAATTAAEPARQDRRVTIVNRTRYTIMEFYASNSGQTSWEEDILGSDVLEAGHSVLINIDDGTGACVFDFKAVFEDGDEAVKHRINVCEISTFNFTE